MIRLAYLAGAFDLIKYNCRKKVNILMYHRFSEKPELFKIDSHNFEKQIKFICSKFNPIHLSTFIAAAEGRAKLPPNSIIITIDDGYQDNFTVAYPILSKYKAPATIFLATDFVDSGSWLWPLKLLFILQNSKVVRFRLLIENREQMFSVENFTAWHKSQLAIFNHLRKLADVEKDLFLLDLAADLDVDVPEKTCGDFLPLTWPQILEMQKDGIEFGSHTCTHPILSRQNNSALINETVASKTLIENRLQQEVISFCYPNGQPEDYNQKVISAVRDAGYRCAVTTANGSNTISDVQPFELKRKGLLVATSHELYRGLLRS